MKTKLARILALACMTAGVSVGLGCAPAYHDYSDYYVDCKYCVPPPLPLPHYPDCVCHSCVGEQYLAAGDVAAEPAGAETPPSPAPVPPAENP